MSLGYNNLDKISVLSQAWGYFLFIMLISCTKEHVTPGNEKRPIQVNALRIIKVDSLIVNHSPELDDSLQPHPHDQ